MSERIVPAQGGRGVLVRAGHAGECVQLAIVSTRGNQIEGVTLDRSQLPALIGALQLESAEADRDLMAALTERQHAAERRHREALERNPWLNGSKSVFPRESYIGREERST